MSRHFEYLRPETIDAAIDMKVDYGPRARFWAGGTDMMLLWQRRVVDFDYCISPMYPLSDISRWRDLPFGLVRWLPSMILILSRI